jgi:hypothetical protein
LSTHIRNGDLELLEMRRAADYESAQWDNGTNEHERALFNLDEAISIENAESPKDGSRRKCLQEQRTEDIKDQEEGAGEDGEASCVWGEEGDEEKDCVE